MRWPYERMRNQLAVKLDNPSYHEVAFRSFIGVLDIGRLSMNTIRLKIFFILNGYLDTREWKTP
jgi:hypothetical protein